MKSLLGKLGNLLSQEYALIRGIRGDVQYINDDLASMQAFLRDLSAVAEGNSHDHRMKDWMKQIRDMAYDIEDCIDDFTHRLPPDSTSEARCSFIFMRIYELWTWWPRRDIAELKVRTQQIAERRNRYGVNNPEHGSSSTTAGGWAAGSYSLHTLIDDVTTAQFIGIKEPVGVMSDMKKLGDWLTEHEKSENELAVVSIVGFGGGKTTIATAFYRAVSSKFDCQASVTVSQNYDLDAVLRSILKQVKPEISNQKHGGSTSLEKRKNLASGIKRSFMRVVPLIRVHGQKGNDRSSDQTLTRLDTMEHDQLVDELKQLLAVKRYILLIDDIWSAHTWDSIRFCLPEKNKNSIIIVTTRFQAVGATCSPTDETGLLHTVNLLTGDEPKNLFNQSVSKSKIRKVGEHVQDQVPDEIWKICGGLPLALVTMAGVVACNPSKTDSYWSTLSQDMLVVLEYISEGLESWRISRKRLIRRWIAEGFASEKQGLTKEEVAETNFNHLMRRNIIRPLEHSSNGKLKTFQVHDMVLEYIVSKSTEENFITVVGGHWLMTASSNKVRRLSMQSSGSKHGSSTKGLNLAQVRSLTVFGNLNHVPFRSFNNGIIQVLDLEGWKGLKYRHMTEICQMVVLKYLSIRQSEIAKIPSKIEKLECLETLDIRETRVEELPKSVGQLKRISNILGGNKNTRKGLRLPQEKGKKPLENPLSPEKPKEPENKRLSSQEKGKGTMKALRVLSGIEIVEESAAVAAGLHQLTGLRKLAIFKLNITKDGDTFKQLLSSIEYLGSCGLRTLAINDENSEFINSLDDMSAPPRYLIALELSGKLEKLPKWITSITTLNKLTISVTVLRTETFKTLQTLRMLFSLTFTFPFSAAKQDQDIIKNILEDNKL
uniref:NB-ARC domain-containing protein n=1 Tax=Leersia perrieri TaxID=77586 RepID=A0A0D9XVG0_9ORYZ